MNRKQVIERKPITVDVPMSFEEQVSRLATSNDRTGIIDVILALHRRITVLEAKQEPVKKEQWITDTDLPPATQAIPPLLSDPGK